MFYHPSDNKATFIIKHLSFLVAILSIIGIIYMVFYDDLKMPQRMIVLTIDIKNKVNICLPEDDKIFEESFFNF